MVINVGVKEAVSDSKVSISYRCIRKNYRSSPVKTWLENLLQVLKLREGMPIGVKVTLRKKNMYDFLDRFINLALPKVRDFQGVPAKFDGRGNYNLGIKEWVIFPEVRL